MNQRSNCEIFTGTTHHKCSLVCGENNNKQKNIAIIVNQKLKENYTLNAIVVNIQHICLVWINMLNNIIEIRMRAHNVIT